jgi:hypothetical protein
MKSSEFVQKIIGDKKINKVEKIQPYLSKNEEWQDALARIMLTGILKHQYYRSVDAQVKEALPLMITAAKKDPDFLLKAAAFARDANMKGMVKVGIAAISGNADESFLSDVKNRIAIIALLSTFHPGQLLQFVELCKSKTLGRGFGSRPQKWVRAVMESWKADRLEEFTLKYPSALNALVRLVHPRLDDTRGNIIKYVLSDGNAFSVKQKAVEALKKPNTKPLTIAKSMLENSIPWDVIKGFAGMKDPNICMAMMTQMGLSALLLNLRSLEEHGVFDNSDGLKALKLKLDEVKFGRSIPIDFVKPYLMVTNESVKGHIVDAIVETLDIPMPYLENKKVGVSIDISGSMAGEPLKTAGMLAVPFVKAGNLWFTTFDTELFEEGEGVGRTNYMSFDGRYAAHKHCPKITGLSRAQQVKELLQLHTNGGTDIGISVRKAIQNRIKLDLHVIITDEQQNTGTPLMVAWNDYKAKINPKAEMWVINASNTEWHSADFNDPSVTVYQSMTPAIFRNLKYLGIDLVSSIHKYDLGKIGEKKVAPISEEE